LRDWRALMAVAAAVRPKVRKMKMLMKAFMMGARLCSVDLVMEVRLLVKVEVKLKLS
jgi:hypothetical protein